MTTPTPNSGFTVPPLAKSPYRFDIGQLPPMPPQPRELKLALILVGLAVLIHFVGRVWHTALLAANLGDNPRPEQAEQLLTSALSPLFYGAIVVLLGWFLWRGYRVGLWLFVIGTGLAALRVLSFAWWLVVGLIRDGSAESMLRYVDAPGPLGENIAAVFAVPVLLLLIRPAVWRWSRRADAIRTVTGLVKRGAPIRQLPRAIYE